MITFVSYMNCKEKLTSDYLYLQLLYTERDTMSNHEFPRQQENLLTSVSVIIRYTVRVKNQVQLQSYEIFT